MSKPNDNIPAPMARTAEAWANSEAARALKTLQANPRVKYITIIVPADACTACQRLAGTYPKDAVPQLPYEACSHPLGCRAYYEPMLEDVYP